MRRLSGVAVLTLACAGCVDTYDGSKVEILFLRGTHVPEGDPDIVGGRAVNPGGRPPSEAHYEMYIVTDPEGARPFHLKNFLITPIVDNENPCFIEGADAVYPVYDGDERPIGLHISQWREKLFELYNADGEIDDQEAGSIADAVEREGAIDALHEAVRAVVSHQFGYGVDAAAYDAFHDDLEALEAALPARELTDPASNQARFELCNEFFDEYPLYYVGIDRSIAIPINGDFIGVVDGADPRNLGFIGGADFSIDREVPEHTVSMRINWQFDDPDDPRAAMYGGAAQHGYHYMAGAPQERTRRVLNIPLRNEVYSAVAAEAAVLFPLDDDKVHF